MKPSNNKVYTGPFHCIVGFQVTGSIFYNNIKLLKYRLPIHHSFMGFTVQYLTLVF